MDAPGHQELDETIDLMDNEYSELSSKQDASAQCKFDVFLKKHVGKNLSLRALTAEQISQEMIGKFIVFLLQDNNIEWQTSMNYLSSVKHQLEAGTGKVGSKEGSDWYRRCRRNLHKQYLMKCITNGKRLNGQAPLMTMSDLINIARILFERNDKKALQDRALLNKQWVAIRRSSDIGAITFDDLE